MEHAPGFKDVFPYEHGDIPASYVSLPEGIWAKFHRDLPRRSPFLFWLFFS